MKTPSIIIGILALGALTLLALSGSSSGGILSGKEFVEAYRSTPGAVLLDVRTPSEFASGHIDGAVNVDFEAPSFASKVAELDPSKHYFVYCRSGNRSGQAIALMKKSGITDITELRGGVAGNQGTITLVTGSPEMTDAYVVDPSDMVDGQALVAQSPKSALTEKEIAGIVMMREEEKLARDVYTTLGAKWGTRIFGNIASSEQTHTDAVKVLLDRYGVTDPSTDDTIGVFTSPVMQGLYTDFVAKGSVSLPEALRVGAMIEDLDIRDLDVLMGETDKADILATYRNLQKGSRNHLRAFVRNLSMSGETYVPQFITEEAFTAIVDAPQERGRI